MENKIGFPPSYFSIEDVYILIASTRDQKHFLFYYEKAISLYRSNILTTLLTRRDDMSNSSPTVYKINKKRSI